MAFRADFLDGAKATSPLLARGATVGLVTGVAAATTGFSLVEGVSMADIVIAVVGQVVTLVLLVASFVWETAAGVTVEPPRFIFVFLLAG